MKIFQPKSAFTAIVWSLAKKFHRVYDKSLLVGTTVLIEFREQL